MFKKVLILVEGFTEKTFVRQSLTPYLLKKAISVVPIVILTKAVPGGKNYTGGISSYSQVKHHIVELLKDSSASIVTTMLDYYALPGDFPGFKEKPTGTCYSKVEFVENCLLSDLGSNKFIPYFQLHEFETLIFACPENLSGVFIKSKKKIDIKKSFDSPEEINEGYDTCPSRRLKAIFPNYLKEDHGKLAMSNADIDVIRSKCPHFNSWLTKLEC
jgi:hypothetical protein